MTFDQHPDIILQILVRINVIIFIM